MGVGEAGLSAGAAGGGAAAGAGSGAAVGGGVASDLSAVVGGSCSGIDCIVDRDDLASGAGGVIGDSFAGVGACTGTPNVGATDVQQSYEQFAMHPLHPQPDVQPFDQPQLPQPQPQPEPHPQP
jgi:hypothetical protein